MAKAKKGPGGARPGAGRKPKEKHLEDFASLVAEAQELMHDPLRLAAWAQRVWAIGAVRVMLGRSHRDLDQELRAFLRGLQGAIPPNVLKKAADLIRADVAKTRTPTGGPPLEPSEPGTVPLGGPAPRTAKR